ncbi:MAG: family 78 glycoside hydrolase catalytic domain [Verrucomicrobiota bacterium]
MIKIPTIRFRAGLAIAIAAAFLSLAAFAAPTHLVEQSPVSITNVAPGVILVDFGRVAFGNLKLLPPASAAGKIKVHFGEALVNGRINSKPPGTVRYSAVDVELTGAAALTAAPRADKRNSEPGTDKHPPAILTPKEWGVVTPFRWVEIEGWPGELHANQIIRRAAFASSWNDDAASFKSSDDMLNRIWELCRYSIKATTFAGLFVDGDRERIPYEADAYLNQLSYYATCSDIQMPRDTFDHLMKNGTWPTEWAPHMVFMAYADWIQTGDTNWLAPRYDSLKAKLLMDRVGPDGLVQSSEQNMKKTDIVDWPHAERDGYEFTRENTVVNAFYLRALKLMTEMGQALHRDTDAAGFAAREAKALPVFQKKFFDAQRGLYRDGATTDHASLHANLFPLAFGLVPEANRATVSQWLAQRGMKCSVYAAQYLLEGLFENGQGRAAIDLMIAPGDRSWRHMVASGTTITWEAWDQKYKPNQDRNHAWGAAPANLLPRFVIGAQPLTAGWKRALIHPHPGNLKFAEGKISTPQGPVLVSWKNEGGFKLELVLPKGMTAKVELPAIGNTTEVRVNGKQVPAKLEAGLWQIAEDVAGRATIELK